jgi:hypothetical protein
MALFDTLQNDLNAARKAQDKPRVLVLGTIFSDAKNRKIELRRDLTDDEVIDVLRKGIKKRRESIELYTGKRDDLERRDVGVRHERADARRARRRGRKAGNDVEQPRILEDAESVRVHRAPRVGTKNPNDARRPFGFGQPIEAPTVTPACSAPRARSH